MTSIRVGRGFTRNLSNYQSARYDAAIEDEVLDGESIEDAYARIRDKVDTLLTADIDNDN